MRGKGLNKFATQIGLLACFTPGLAVANKDENIASNTALFNSFFEQTTPPDSEEIAFSKCMGIAPEKMQEIGTKAMKNCFETYKSEPNDVFISRLTGCATPEAIKLLGVSWEKFEACGESGPQSENSDRPSLRDVEDLASDIIEKKRELVDRKTQGATAEEIASRQRSIAKAEPKLAQLVETLDDYDRESYLQWLELEERGVGQLVLGQEDRITLPVFSPSAIIGHFANGIEIMGYISIPCASYASSAPASAVRSFYKKQLPEFDYKDIGDGEHLLMKAIPKGFDYLTDIELVMKTPNIQITEVMDNSQPPTLSMFAPPPGARTIIKICYIPKEPK